MTIANTHTQKRRQGCDPLAADFILDINQRRDPPVEKEITTPLTVTATTAHVGGERCSLIMT